MKGKLWMALLVLAMLLLTVFPLWEALSNFSGQESSSTQFRPTVSLPSGVDVDFNRVSDELDLEIAQRVLNHTEKEPVNVIVMLSDEPDNGDAGAFVASGGIVTTNLWEFALYGFGGQIPYDRVVNFAGSRSNVLLVEKEAVCNATVAYAAEQVGARTYVWNTLGLQGDSNSALAIIDTGIDGSHVDFASGYGSADFSKKIVGWNDQVSGLASPYDDNGHGSHCSGLAAGDGFFSVDELGFAQASFGADYAEAGSGGYVAGGMMINKTGAITVSVQWANSINMKLSSLAIYYGGKSLSTSSWTPVATVTTSNENTWYTFSYNVASLPSGGYDMYHIVAFVESGRGSLDVRYNMSWPYLPPSDGFSAWTGIAPSSKLVGVKVLPGTNFELVGGINWIIENKMTYHITVASMSLGFSGEVSSVDVAIVNLVDSGVCTIVSAGNDGSGANYIFTPGSVDEVLTVAAMNQFDSITDYSSQGGTSRYSGNTVKPDVTAPGGSHLAVPLFSVDTNYDDGEGAWTDAIANDAAHMQGTSMSCPVVAGAAQILVEALGGFDSWSYTRTQALLPKMLLLMTATETYPNTRESGISPTLERGGKDVQEGYGRINLDAAADAVLKKYLTGTTVVDSLGLPPSLSDISVLGQRLCWARNVQLFSGVTYDFELTVPVGADFDLYLYNTTGNNYGEPVILTKSTSTVAGVDESIEYTPTMSGEYFVVVKRAREDTGGGQFILTSTPSQSAHLLLSAEPNQASYSIGQSVTLATTVFNELNPALNSTLTLTVTGPNNYYYYETQTVNVTANSVEEYKFNWNIPDAIGTYVVEVSLVPAQLTAYDTKWIEVK